MCAKKIHVYVIKMIDLKCSIFNKNIKYKIILKIYKKTTAAFYSFINMTVG